MIGVIEGFFGPEWSESARRDYAPFLRSINADFFLYAPKRDPNLRKNWREEWSKDYLRFLTDLGAHFHAHQVKFGVALSPFGLGDERNLLKQKIKQLTDTGVDILGLFFDDMPVTAKLADTQIEVVELARSSFCGKIIFCPSFYTPDPILDKVFGARPANYLEEIGTGIHPDVDIAWTGPKVISEVIPTDHLKETTSLLKRKPFLWENLYANDGPKNCHFLKLKDFSGRESNIEEHIAGLGLNMMNQPHLSMVLMLSSLKVIREKKNPPEAFNEAMQELLPKELTNLILENRAAFLTEGDLKLGAEKKLELNQKLSRIHHPVASEIQGWLAGDYTVGPECLTD